MIRPRNPLVLLLVAALVLAACTDSGSLSDATVDDSAEPTTTDPTTSTDAASTDGFELVAPDPDPTPIEPGDDVRIGTLDNGLTYYVRSNQAPGGSLSLRLVVDAGSLLQEEPESGAAHFLEHLLFNGTENFPDNELARALARIGVQFGADLNAYTSFDETVYQLDITNIDTETIDTGFDVLADWASAATITQDATVAERGVVREEIRLRDEGADGLVAARFNHAYGQGTPYEDREPGGRSDLILETDSEDLRKFYDRWYRPDLMAVIAVGDLSLDAMEEEIRERFESFEGRSDGTERPEITVEPITTAYTEVITHPEMARRFGSIDFSLTTLGRGTIGGERITLMQDLLGLMIGSRLREAADRGEVELDQPFVTRFDETRAQSFLGFNFESPDLAIGTEYILSELRRIELAGFTDAEYERAAGQIQTSLDQLVSGARSIQDHSYADSYVAHFLGTGEASSVEDAGQRLSTLLAELTAADLTELFRWEMSQSAPIVIMVGPDEADLPTVDELDAAIEAALGAEATEAGLDDGTVIEALMEAPEAVEPVEENKIAEPGAREWVFANGVTVRFVQSDIAANHVDLYAVAEGGWSLLEPEDAVLAPYAVSAVANSGVGEHDRVALRRFRAGNTIGLSPFIDETSEGFQGGSDVEDIEFLFQQLHLAVAEPRIDEIALAEMIDNAEDRGRRVTTDAAFATFDALSEARFDGDERFLLVPPVGLKDLGAEQALDIYNQRHGSVDDLLVIVVGDIDEEQIALLARQYLGTLPVGADADPDSWADVRPAEITDTIRRDVVAGSGEATGTVAVFYPSELPIDATTRIELLVLEQIFGTRILDVVREELGASYGGQASVGPEVAPGEGVEVLLFANIDPDRGEEILAVMLSEAAALAADGPTQDELDRAISVLRADFDLIGNGDYIEMLLTRPEEDVLTFQRRTTLLAAVQPADITALAAEILPTDVRIEVVTVPSR